MKIVLATNNVGKISEFNEIFSQSDIEIIPQNFFDIPEIEETGSTFLDNALLKAQHASQYTNFPVLADDSGLVVDVLNGAPGVYSARYAGVGSTSQQKIGKLLEELKNIPYQHRSAHFHCTLVLLNYPGMTAPLICEANWHGSVLMEPQGTQGFGYDPIVFIPEKNCAVAELSAVEKNQLSHRGQAVKKLLSVLEKMKIDSNKIREI